MNRIVIQRIGALSFAVKDVRMEISSLTKYWPLIYSTIREFWEITEPHIEDAAIRDNVPVELYYYSELGLEYFSIEKFQKRDPFTNPEQFERLFARFDVKGWIMPLPDEEYQVAEMAREGTHRIIQAGDEQLSKFEKFADVDLARIVVLLKQIVAENELAPEPPEKWAIFKRFHVANIGSPSIVCIREYMMDLFAYRDDSHLSAARPHFGQAGIAWSVLGSIWSGDAVTAEQMAETMESRGYDVSDYEVAIQAAVEIGWVEASDVPGKFRPTKKGEELREQVENLTNEYFYRSWSVLTQDELDELYGLLTKLHEQLIAYKKSLAR
jgi:hypothetical protein